MNKSVNAEIIEQKIFFIRGHKIMIDRDLADLYGVETKYLNRQVKRNESRFPDEFMFQLNQKEKDELVTNCHRFNRLKHSSSLPYAFTEHGVAMLASVLNSPQAVKMSILIVKVFINLRKVILDYREIIYKLREIEEKIGRHDKDIQTLFAVIRRLMEVPQPKPKGKIGFHP